jgi:hypothetical protein
LAWFNHRQSFCGVFIMRRWFLALPLAALLAGCGVVGGVASVAGTAVSVTASAVGTTAEVAADVVTAPLP